MEYTLSRKTVEQCSEQFITMSFTCVYRRLSGIYRERVREISFADGFQTPWRKNWALKEHREHADAVLCSEGYKKALVLPTEAWFPDGHRFNPKLAKILNVNDHRAYNIPCLVVNDCALSDLPHRSKQLSNRPWLTCLRSIAGVAFLTGPQGWRWHYSVYLFRLTPFDAKCMVSTYPRVNDTFIFVFCIESHSLVLSASLYRKWAQSDRGVPLLCSMQTNLLRPGLITRSHEDLFAFHIDATDSGR